MATTTRKNTEHVADICLYGTGSIGHGFIVAARTIGKPLGDGTPKPEWSMTEAVFMAVDSLRDAGVTSGRACVYFPGGEQCAWIDLADRVPYVGDMTVEPAPVYVMNVSELGARS